MILERLLERKKTIIQLVEKFIAEFGDADDEYVYDFLEELEEINESIGYYMAMA